MEFVLLFGVLAIVIGIIVIAVRGYDAKMKKLVAEGKAAKRERTFWMQQTYFSTTTGSVDKIFSTMNKTLLNEINLKYEVEAGDCVLFSQKVSGGSFAATLRAAGINGEKHHYVYQIDQYRGTGGYMKPKCLLSANILLTSIEKAFLQLDKETSVSRRTAAFQTT